MNANLKEAAHRRVYSLLKTSVARVAAQMLTHQKEAIYQKALAAELSTQLPTQTEAPCPVLYTTSDGATVTLATDRLDILITPPSRAWAAIVEIKRGATPRNATDQVLRYCHNYQEAYATPLACAFLVTFGSKQPTIESIPFQSRVTPALLN